MAPRKVVIAVMGMTGMGKSTFIRCATESTEIKIGHDYKSCTATVAPYTFTQGELEITLIDTPGFSDTVRSEGEVLQEIAGWLEKSYRNSIRLSGIIYMQTLTDKKITGPGLRNLKMFRELCGDDPLKSVILVTTGWGLSQRAGLASEAENKESQLLSDPDFWQPLVRRGAQVARFQDTTESARSIISDLADLEPVTLKLQEEMVNQNRNLIDTSAGKAVNEEMLRLEAMYKTEIENIQREMDSALAARDQDLHDALAESKEVFNRRMDEVTEQQRIMQYERRNEQRQYKEDLAMIQAQQKEDQQALRLEHETQMRAQKVADQMQFEEIVAKIRANESKVRQEERQFLEQKIRELEKRPANESRGKSLLLSLAPVLSSAALTLLGFPMLLGNPFGSLIGGN